MEQDPSAEIRNLSSLNVFKTSFHGKDYLNTLLLIVTLIIISFFVFLTL